MNKIETVRVVDSSWVVGESLNGPYVMKYKPDMSALRTTHELSEAAEYKSEDAATAFCALAKLRKISAEFASKAAPIRVRKIYELRRDVKVKV